MNPPEWDVVYPPTAPPPPYSQATGQPAVLTDEQIRQVAAQFDIETRYARELKHLTYYDIVIILDDSGSMIAPTSSFQTRWDEAHKMLQIISDLLRQLKGTDNQLLLLNRAGIHSTSQILDAWQSFRPGGPTPIRAAFENLKIGFEVPTLIFLITDGEPTIESRRDGRYEVSEDRQFYQFIQNFLLKNVKVYLNVILCTSSDATVDYWKKVDNLPRVDVIDDYETEQKRCKGGMTFGTYVAKAMLGALVPELDNDDDDTECCTIL